MVCTTGFTFDPILSNEFYPELLTLFKEETYTDVDYLFFSAKHFYKKDKELIRQKDGTLYLIVAPFFNLSLLQTEITRDGESYPFSPVGYTKDMETYRRYAKLNIEVFDNIQDLTHSIYGFCEPYVKKIS